MLETATVRDDGFVTWPCGCLTVNVEHAEYGKTMMFKPCELRCVVYKEVLAMGRDGGLDVRHEIMRCKNG